MQKIMSEKQGKLEKASAVLSHIFQDRASLSMFFMGIEGRIWKGSASLSIPD